MTKYNIRYDNGEFNYINDNIFADSPEEAKRLFISKWGVANEHAITIKAS